MIRYFAQWAWVVGSAAFLVYLALRGLYCLADWLAGWTAHSSESVDHRPALSTDDWGDAA